MIFDLNSNEMTYKCHKLIIYILNEMLINETHLSNQHVELMLDSEFLVTELEALFYFTHKVTLSLLHIVLKVFPKLFKISVIE